jgi:hypothetical protein
MPYEFLVIKLGRPIVNPNWNFCNDIDSGKTHRTLAELGTVGYNLVSVVHNREVDGSETYLYYLQRAYDERDGVNRELPSNYNYHINW